MKLPIGRLLLSALLVAAGVACWAASNIAQELADRHERLATLRGGANDRLPDRPWLSRIAGLIDADSSRHAATERYWEARYDALTSQDSAPDADAGGSLIAANAAFRGSQREAAGRLLDADRLEQAMRTYAGVLQNGGFSHDAAYNYEFVARLRDAAAKSRVRTPPPRDAPTIHGRPGTHPPPTRGDEFEVLTPMDFGDREAQPEPTPGVKPPRKG